jgi:3-hydroxy acid dehydrogenase / malonic semialdehyde reductase
MADLSRRVAVVTGASSGIGEATAVSLAAAGATVVIGARRKERLEAVAGRIEAAGGKVFAFPLDVADSGSCEDFVARTLADVGDIDCLVNNAGLARGLAVVAESDESHWREMMEANVMGLMRMTRAFLPTLEKHEHSDIVHVSSIAGLQPYAKGAAYCASKAAVEAFVQALRFEVVDKGIRQFVIQPGMVETEFSKVRFSGDDKRADAVYDGVDPLTAADVAECILFAVSRPANVQVQTMLLTAGAQASATVVSRRS